jgi:hypothetical protein
MKILVYDADQIVPIDGLYEHLGGDRIIFSNADQEIQNFDSKEVSRLLKSSHLDTAIFYIPSKIQDQFVELVNQQLTHQWEEDNSNLSIGNIGLIGNDQLSQFFDKMVLKKVVKPKGYETTEEGNRFDNIGEASYLNPVENIEDKIVEAIERTLHQNQIMWKKFLWKHFLMTLSVGVIVIFVIFFGLSRMITQPSTDKSPEPEKREVINKNPTTTLAKFLSELEPGNRIVIVAISDTEKKAKEKVEKIKNQHPELFLVQKGTPLHNRFGDGIYYDASSNKWVIYIGGYYSSDSAKKLETKAINELGMKSDTYYKPVPKRYQK